MREKKSLTEEIVSLTKQLIRFKTLSHDLEQIRACTAFIESYLRQYEIKFIRKDINGVPSLLITPGKDDFSLLLMSHIDVVAGPEKLFDPVVKDGRLHGRGSVDDKYAVALSMVLMKNWFEKYRDQGRGQDQLDFGILITSDEEIGGKNGAARMLADIRPEFTIALDGGSPDEIITREKGILRLKLEAFGQTCHGSRPWLGQNAIDMLVRDYLIIKKYFEVSAPNHWHRTLNPAVVEGGQVINQVPDYSRMLFDVRFTETDHMAKIVAQIQQEIKGKLTIVSEDPVFESKQNTYLERLSGLDPKIRLGAEHGASDARHLMPYNLNGVVWGAQGNLSHHGDDEHVEIKSLELLYDRLDRFISML